ncbi:MAG TPA: DUF3160 domain-containing protein [Bacteroidota bacterium]|nr:DUF3160 domain-containing protein [Bacteroidota bacterium]
MNSLRLPFVLALLVACVVPRAVSQSDPLFDIQQYESFLAAHTDMTSTQLLAMHPAGMFARRSPVALGGLDGFHAIDSVFQLTPYERSLVSDHGFVVTDRLRYPTMGAALFDIYNRDLPLFLSADAILHAIHSSYDTILRNAEETLLIRRLDTLLVALRAQVPALDAAYAADTAMHRMTRDLDVYLTVACALLEGSAAPYFPENAAEVGDLQSLITGKQAAAYPLFSTTYRLIDFSQFTIRGHYTQSAELGRYFQSMIWLGRTELYLLSPANVIPSQQWTDIRRQTIDAALLVEALDRAGGFPKLAEIDAVIRECVGESDNVTLPNMKSLLATAHIVSARQLLDSLALGAFQDSLRSQKFAFQRINSQILVSANPTTPDNIQPAAALLFLGQRFVVDSYVTGNVVYDKISNQGHAVWRGLPSSLDVLFALGNDAAAQLLTGQLELYKYATNLAALRYLIDGYDDAFWTSSLYNAWLSMIRACNPPADRSALPGFMNTASWWQEKMNTQLASWAELRHDNLLYAKQSYTGMTTCSFPRSYVEPIPALYDAVRVFAQTGKDRLAPLLGSSSLDWYFSILDGVADTLGAIARKELSGTALSVPETAFLQRMLYTSPGGCGGSVPDGWYYRLYYQSSGFSKPDFVVADVHTCPGDEAGNLVGWVLHVGTGPVNMGIVAASTPGAGSAAYIGPVMSYAEHVTGNFLRLTDDQWSKSYALCQSARPSFVNLYLADSTGGTRGPGESLLTGISPYTPGAPAGSPVLFQNYPNPFNPGTLIRWSLPARADVTLAVYNTLGQRVALLVRETQERGYHQVTFDGTGLASGVYFYRLQAGTSVQSNRMILLK